MRLTVAFALLAAVNGCPVRRATPVLDLVRESDDVTAVHTGGDVVRTRFVVNAAGAAAGVISAQAGGEPLAVWPRKGRYSCCAAPGSTPRTAPTLRRRWPRSRAWPA
jgi:L-2-hydroxyglutarate oxidase LhgO